MYPRLIHSSLWFYISLDQDTTAVCWPRLSKSALTGFRRTDKDPFQPVEQIDDGKELTEACSEKLSEQGTN